MNTVAIDNGVTVKVDRPSQFSGLALNSSRIAVDMERAGTSPSAPAVAARDISANMLFFHPEGGFPSYSQLTLHEADSSESAEHFQRQGFVCLGSCSVGYARPVGRDQVSAEENAAAT